MINRKLMLLPLLIILVAATSVGTTQVRGWDGPWGGGPSYGPDFGGCGAYCAGQITANWNTIQSQTQSFAYNASAQVLHMVNDTTSRFVMHPSLAHVEATPIAMGTGFLTGFFLGLKH